MDQEKVKNVGNGFVSSDRGSGVGVLLSRVSTEVQGGNFTLDSNEGVGTRISIALPMPPEVRQ
jgi:signal transduction histidine kinase